jgi:hypothetical protein
MSDCMICDLYAVIDRHLTDSGTDAIADYTADLVTVLPPRGHAFHKLAIWEQRYVSRLADLGL